MARTGTRLILGGAPVTFAQGDVLGSGAADPGGILTALTGSEWRLHREWYGRSALADLLDTDDVIEHALYHCHDLLLDHKTALFDHLVLRWRDLFNVSFDVLLHDLTSTYFEIDPPLSETDKRQFGYSRDHRSDCVQGVIALTCVAWQWSPRSLAKPYIPESGGMLEAKRSATLTPL